MGAIDDATGEFLPGAHFTEQEITVGYLRVLRDILREKRAFRTRSTAIATAACDATTSIGRSRKRLRAGRSQHREDVC
jgi:hypothetical protein